jgi:DNA-binding NtrC family response regulator
MLLHWRGTPPPSALLKRFEAVGVEVSFGKLRKPPALSVVGSGTKDVPKVRVAGPWVWAPRQHPGAEPARRAVLAGAADVIAIDSSDAVARFVARAEEALSQQEPLPESQGFVAESAVAKRVLRDILHAARTSMPVLLTGETGTGKELAARLVHDWSRRQKKLFLPINCAAIPDELIEAELFGYVRGAFSGAIRDYDGLLMAAEGGTVFLDEIDDTPPTLQAKLLRVLEDRVVSRLGQNEWHHIDFRIVAATNRDLRALIARGHFGEDLYERLAIVHVHLPPLRERAQDLPALALHFVERFYAEEPPEAGHKPVRAVALDTLAALADYGWPGNVRELRNVIYESLVRKRGGDELLLSDLPRRILERRPPQTAPEPLIDSAELGARLEARSMNLRQELENLERSALVEALRLSGGQPSRAAELLGEVGRGSARDPAGTVRAMMRRLGIRPK